MQIAIEVLCNPGDVLLVPNPAFPLYQTIADHAEVAVAKYCELQHKCQLFSNAIENAGTMENCP